eukprot:CAMPEP_0185040562 /NCGR_PEP_ID=MMETSP1103-20130426/38782_1 /TAXON_ID=36769 /ORGANISM="Paraphysomonas bandaiensis, Strain Caron Lab Isolate" /LENGTH=806 /DNA_ID=CAMNT_0027579923 /DNA_START=84 /DNA_END=2501 /DNA_ORIENTATION=+
MNAPPSIYVPVDISKRAQVLISKGTGQEAKEGVELLLKNDMSAVSEGTPPPGVVDAGATLKKGLALLANSPYEALGLPIGAQTVDVRKAYKKMALKYHPDKNPQTTPLFQAIHSAHEKLSDRTNRKQEEAAERARAKARAAAASRPPARESPAQHQQKTAYKSTSKKPTSHHQPQAKKSQNGHQQQKQYYFHQEPRYFYDNNSADNPDTGTGGCSPSGWDDDTGGVRGYRFAEAQRKARAREQARQRAEQRKGQGQSNSGTDKTKGKGMGDNTLRRAGREQEQMRAAARAAELRARGGYGGSGTRASYSHQNSTNSSSRNGNNTRSSCSPPETSSAYSTSSKKSAPIWETHEKQKQQAQNEGWWKASHPSGLKACATDSTTAELTWNPSTAPTTTHLWCELSWREAQRGGRGRGQWEVSGAHIEGCKVRKKNLSPGVRYHFRVRYAGTDPNTHSAGRGPWSGAAAVTMPLIQESHHTHQEHKQRFFAKQHSAPASGYSYSHQQSYEQPPSTNNSMAEEVDDDEELTNNILGQSAKMAWSEAGEEEQFYARHMSRAGSPPAEEVVSDEEAHNDTTNAREDTPSCSKPDSSDNDKGMVTYDLIAPESHTGRYIHSVHSRSHTGSPVVGYIASGRSVLCKKTVGGWALVQAHWPAEDGNGGGYRSRKNRKQREIPWGWARIEGTTSRNKTSHVYLRPTPVSGDQQSKSCPKDRTEYTQQETRDQYPEEEDYQFGDYVAEEADDMFDYSPPTPVWYEQQDENGSVYYYNASTGESQWEAPEWVEETDATSGARYFVRLNTQDASPLNSTW